jgi:hypothetical protein
MYDEILYTCVMQYSEPFSHKVFPRIFSYQNKIIEYSSNYMWDEIWYMWYHHIYDVFLSHTCHTYICDRALCYIYVRHTYAPEDRHLCWHLTVSCHACGIHTHVIEYDREMYLTYIMIRAYKWYIRRTKEIYITHIIISAYMWHRITYMMSYAWCCIVIYAVICVCICVHGIIYHAYAYVYMASYIMRMHMYIWHHIIYTYDVIYMTSNITILKYL